MDQDESNGGGQMYLNLRYIYKIELTGFTNWIGSTLERKKPFLTLDRQYVRKKEVNRDPKLFASVNGRMVLVNWERLKRIIVRNWVMGYRCWENVNFMIWSISKWTYWKFNLGSCQYIDGI